MSENGQNGNERPDDVLQSNIDDVTTSNSPHSDPASTSESSNGESTTQLKPESNGEAGDVSENGDGSQVPKEEESNGEKENEPHQPEGNGVQPSPEVQVNGELANTPASKALPAEPTPTSESPRIGHTRQQSTVSVASSTATVNNIHIFKKTFETIIGSKEAKKNESFKNTIQNAINSLNVPDSRDPQIIFNALKATCEVSSSSELKILAIDLFAKLFDYAQFEDKADKFKLTDASVDVISECFEGEGTDPELELQVVRALMHSVLLMSCHGASLLKAVRQIYNVFIFSLSARNQAVAQGILAQVISAIFQRITDSPNFKGKTKSSSNINIKSSTASKEELDIAPESKPESREKLTLKTLERLNSDAYDDQRVNDASHASEGDEDLVVKDAFLIFRAMCKLSVKPLESETIDMKSHSVRSKLLSLHIIHTILREHIEVFLSDDVVILSSNSSEQTRLISAVRQYICLSLSRNAASPLAPVFELSLEIFWLIISNLRSDFKREIPVFWDEIYFPVAEMKTSTPHQKRYLLSIIEKLCNDSRCIIEFYLNYDCDSTMSNICEKIIDYLTKLALIRVEVTPQQKLAYRENKRNGISVYDISKIANLTSSTMSSKPPEPEVYNYFPLEYALKMTSIGCSVAFLRSLYSWVQKGINSSLNSSKLSNGNQNTSHLNLHRDRSGTVDSNSSTGNNSRNASFVNTDQFNETDDPEQFENLKLRKKAFLNGIRQFNQKAKKGISYFLENNFIESDEPDSIAAFLLETDGLDKAVIGEYLGEGEEYNISIMHAFVDQMEFTNTEFVDSMRRFLQSFRLPGEAQKIDRFMLKFAERYVLGNPSVFSNADAAYVLAYSVILLNTDLHSPQIKNRMTFENFVANNAGIDDGKDLPRDLLQRIYEEIASNEIKLQSEQHAALLAGDLAVSTGPASVGFFGSRDLNREAYNFASKEMSTKTEKLVRNLGRKLKSDDSNGVFYAASHVHHVKSIFDTLWMSILAGLTPPFKEYDEEDTCKTCLEGIKLSIKIACMFDLQYARTSFIGALVQFENLNNYEEMKAKNVDAIYIMLDIAVSEGNHLGESWSQVLISISQLERLQLIAQGVDQDSIPDVSVAKLVNRGSVENSRVSTSFFSQFTAAPSASQTASNKFHNQHLTQYVAQLLTKTELDVAIDKVFTNSANLSGEGIVAFVKALSDVAAEEIESSGQSSNPRTFSLQKVVDICYYNMNRIRLEWSQLWATMGETFNSVGCHSNLAILFFALDSLRQLSMRFLEIDELAHFKFQKEFLKPFEYVILHNDSLEVRDMVLECLNNMILGRADKIKSGWKTIFGVLTAAAKEKKESLVMKSYKMATWINKEYIDEVRAQDLFADLVVCFTELAKNERFQKASLLSLDVLLKLINQVAQLSFGDKSKNETSLAVNGKDSEKNDHLVKLWFPILFGFHDIIMTGEELEVRSRALNYLFNVLLDYGEYFEIDFWDLICRQLLFPIFSVLSNHWELSVEDTNDKLSVWLSTTLIQALKSMITLFTHYFDALSGMLDEFLSLIISCICQENDTIARIGRECLSTLLIDNGNKFNAEQWNKVCGAFSTLFELTTAKELFTSDPLRNRSAEDAEGGDFGSNVDLNDPSSPKNTLIDDSEARLRKSKEKSSIVVKSVLQLLLIQTLSELFENDNFYEAVPYEQLMVLADLLNKSYSFAKKFNDDYDLRVRLWNAGVIERLPNLLKQESSSSAVLINIMFRMYCDDEKTSTEAKDEIMGQIIPICNFITERFAEFDETNQQRNISTWKPVIIEIYQGYVELDDEDFVKFTPQMYELTLKLFSRSMSADLRQALRSFLSRVGEDFVNQK
ncbi:Sec7-domain-containing protein [Suhomyces tanzawaensis NRRL Y-17324]|uniref:Sec7-domain-containing protein n=1 Tax=Suhomyces tanzawaensis NRRL Y-17324 TaxID=984487 RepID=A0A1E4SGE7_9ASCO|nr:Sec7-domain-containing protein [Suhomyces tanzawaensis NRRL Y-17324]ODV78589.1 Sec7-domain-containing protein [Suhomyces tanzawaensis NRRL Y-17324]